MGWAVMPTVLALIAHTYLAADADMLRHFSHQVRLGIAWAEDNGLMAARTAAITSTGFVWGLLAIGIGTASFLLCRMTIIRRPHGCGWLAWRVKLALQGGAQFGFLLLVYATGVVRPAQRVSDEWLYNHSSILTDALYDSGTLSVYGPMILG